MKKVLNWTIGSLFRTFGRIFAYLIAGGIIAFLLSQNDFKMPSWTRLLGIDYVYAATSPNWASDLPTLQQTLYKNCTGTSTCSSDISLSQDSVNNRRYIFNTTDISIASNGVLIMNNSGNLKQGYVYQVNYYVCSNGNLNPSGSSFYISAINYNSPGTKYNTYELFSSSALNGTPLSGSESYSYCRKFEAIIVPSSNQNWVGLRLKNMSAVDTAFLYGYEVEELGIYSNEVETIVNRALQNSGVATSSELNQVSTDIQTQQQNTTNAINDGLNNTCSNEFDSSGTYTKTSGISSYTATNTSVSVVATAFGYAYKVISLTPNTNYHLKFTNGGSQICIYAGTLSSSLGCSNTGTLDFTTTSSTSYSVVLYGTANQTNTYSNIMISKTNDSYCQYGTSSSKLDQTNSALNSLNDSINDDSSTGAQNEASSFFSSFTTNDHGLTGIITAPLNAINTLTSASCTPLHLPIPFLENKYLDLPCMRAIYVSNFADFMNLYDIITLGIVSYWIMVRIFALVKDFKNPEHDEVEVMDL